MLYDDTDGGRPDPQGRRVEEPPFDVQDEDVEVDLNNLIDLSMSFQPLRLSLQRILKRVRYLEGDNQVKSIQIKDLQDAIGKLQQKQAAVDQAEDDRNDIWEELERLANLIGDLQGDDRRPTIKELYHARQEKEKEEHQSPTSSAGSRRKASGTGEAILDKASEQLPVHIGEEEEREDRLGGGGHGDDDGDGDGDEDMGRHGGDGDGDDDDDDGGERANNSASGRAGEDENNSSGMSSGGAKSTSKASSGKSSKRPAYSAEEREDARRGDDNGNDGDDNGAEDGEDDGRSQPFGSNGQSMTDGQQDHYLADSPSSSKHRGDSAAATDSKSAPGTRPAGSSGSGGKRRPGSEGKRGTSSGSRKYGSAGNRGTSAESSSALSPSRRSLGNSQSGTVFEKLKRDGDDISYLNRVVAEILAEMKGLHGDVDLLRTLNGVDGKNALDGSNASDPFAGEDGDGFGGDGDGEDGAGGRGGRGGRHGSGSGAGGSGSGRSEMEALREHIKKAGALTSDDIEAIKNFTDSQDRVRDLERLVSAMEKANERVQDKLDGILDVTEGTTEINPVQFGLMAGTVKGLEKQLDQLYRSGVKDWSAEIEDLKNQLSRLKRDAGETKERAERAERAAKRVEEKTQNRVGFVTGPNGTDGGNGENGLDAAALQLSEDLWRKLEEITDRLDNADSEMKRLDDEKADRNAMQRLRDELQNLKRLVDLNSKRDASRHNVEGESGDFSETKALFQELQQQLVSQMKSANHDKEQARDEMNNLMEFVRQLDHRKADATLVANKAERDYVENALERLMREVEQVLNATNGGLIDTLDKSLNILRDMIDAKASKQDIARLQQYMEEEGGSKAAADGLMGFKGYRCLGCNRPVDSMRPRTLPSSMDPFLNRNPQTYPQDSVTRTIQQQQQATALLEQHASIQ